ncbi:tRNA 4-thiouridine(8) synthase ThiI [Treponema sp.]
MSTTYLIKLGELTLKGGNREEFELRLKHNLRSMLHKTGSEVLTTRGRFFLRCPETSEARAEDALSRIIGISGWAKARIAPKTVEAVLSACVKEAALLVGQGKKTFKIEARRSDKGFPLDSYGIMREAGGAVLEAHPELSVDVHNPDGIIEVEIREQAYIYGLTQSGIRGLPVGTAGRGLLLLSGGIDSPVAGFLMGKRGMRIDAVHFHSYPYTSAEAQEKVVKLATLLSRYLQSVRLTTVGFTQVQVRIKERAPDSWATILLRMAMMELSGRLARANKSKCLITGESLSQVASQTIENLSCTESRARMPVLRPLIAIDKIDTVDIAKKIGSYETSILPYPDCCALFSTEHPVLKADLMEATALYDSLALTDILEDALRDRTEQRIGGF